MLHALELLCQSVTGNLLIGDNVIYVWVPHHLWKSDHITCLSLTTPFIIGQTQQLVIGNHIFHVRVTSI